MLLEKYAQLDNALIESISKGRKSVSELSHPENGLWALVEPYRAKNPWRGGLTPISLILEKRLQELRKHGYIFFDGKGWLLSAL